MSRRRRDDPTTLACQAWSTRGISGLRQCTQPETARPPAVRYTARNFYPSTTAAQNEQQTKVAKVSRTSERYVGNTDNFFDLRSSSWQFACSLRTGKKMIRAALRRFLDSPKTNQRDLELQLAGSTHLGEIAKPARQASFQENESRKMSRVH